MTRNEKITQVMGWMYGGHPECNMSEAKELQAKMRQDGWNILIMNTAKNEFIASAWRDVSVGHMTAVLKTEQQAIFDLFCKVFNIEGEG